MLNPNPLLRPDKYWTNVPPDAQATIAAFLAMRRRVDQRRDRQC